MHATLDDLVIALYVTIDELLGPDPRCRFPGRKPRLSDAELLCLAVAQVLLGYHSEARWLRFCHCRLGHLFPYLPHQPGYNKRLRGAAHLLTVVLRDLAARTPSWDGRFRLLDATPLPCGASRQTVKRSALWPDAGYGWCASHSRWFWGFKLYLVCAPDGLPITWCLANPKLGERDVAEALLDDLARAHGLAPGTIIVADKGFAGTAFAQHLSDLAVALVRPDRTDEPARFGSLGGLRQWVESVFDTSKTSSAWNATVAAAVVACSSGWRSGCSRWPRVSGSTGCSASPTSAPWSPTTTDSTSIQSELII